MNFFPNKTNALPLGLSTSGNNLNMAAAPPTNLDEVCTGNNNSNADQCSAICSQVSCCFSDSSPYNNDVNISTNNNSPSSCYVHFEDVCSRYAPYCDPNYIAQEEPVTTTAATVVVNLPPPSSDLEALCSFSVDFGSSSEPSCVANNEERCKEYSLCATLYDQES
jgi:hypothetical protein